MLVKFANIVAFGLAAFGVQQAIATPVHDTESHDIARRSRFLKCGWAKKNGKDLGCLCDSAVGQVNLDFDVSDVINILFSKGSNNYPPGCRPTCDNNGGYWCPNGKDSKGNCLDDHGCEGGSCWDNGLCCPGGTVNKGGICCPTGCENHGGKCVIPEPPKVTCGENEEPKDGKCKCKHGYSREHDKAPCMKDCPPDQMRKGKDCVCKHDHQELVKGVCKDKCKPGEERNKDGECKPKCPMYTTFNGHECECDDKSKTLVKGHCEPKCPPETQKWNGHECECKDTSKMLVKGHCEPRCPKDDQKWNGHECECKDMSKMLVKGHCEPRCPKDDQKWNGHECECKDDQKKLVNGHCELRCPKPDQKWNGHECVCKDDKKVLKNGHCEYPCPEGQKYNGKQCECEDKTKELVKGHCEPKCPDDQKRNDKGHCECKKHEFVKDADNICRPVCKDGKVLNKHENTCDCPPNTEKKGDKCVPKCHEPKKLNEHTNMCECPWGFKNGPSDTCVIECKDGKVADSSGKKCICPHPKIEDKHGKCVNVPECKHPKELNTWKNTCECVDGYKEDWHGNCVLKCKGDKIPNKENTMCVCPEHKVEKEHGSNQCVDPAPTCKHPEKLSNNGKKCVCEDGFKRNEHGVCVKDCGWGKKWCKTKCCRDDQEEDNWGNCGCPHGWKEFTLFGKTICKPDFLLKV